MTGSLSGRSVAAAFFALAIGSAPALAQDQSPTAPAQPAPQATTPAAPAQTKEGREMTERVERHIAELHRRLHITDAEKPQWDAFAQVMRENAAHMDQAYRARAESPSMNAVEDLRTYTAIAQAHAEDMQRLLPAFQALYAALSPQQQHTADEVFREFEQRRDARHAS
jgi:hypothetical protein